MMTLAVVFLLFGVFIVFSSMTSFKIEKDKEYDALESMWLAEKGINKLIRQQFQQAKELLGELSSALNKTLWQWENPMEQGFKLGNKIEEFLKEKE